MSEMAFDLTEARFDFSADSRVKDTLLQSLLARQKAVDPSRVPLSLDELGGAGQGGAGNSTRLERSLPTDEMGRKL